MSYWLDLVGSYIIGAMVVVLISMLDIFIGTSSTNVVFNNIVQGNLSAAVDVIHNDFYKIGYRSSGQSIEVADSNQIKFHADIKNYGIIDTIYYYIGNASQLTSSKNPNDKLLYKELNDSTPLPSITLTNFKLTYYDSLGENISYSDLVSQSYRDKIRTIEVYLKVESQEPVDGVYQGAEWLEKITPKNL